jgi:uncharacterized protein YyaL (SSP411 family)
MSFLLRYAQSTDDVQQQERCMEMVEFTLLNMRAGGIYDHAGGGFHRYATDNEWLVPHFEKMLYDNALLSFTYLEAFQCTRNPLYLETLQGIFSYVERDLSHPEGAFYCAEDADSEGEEGKFYVWEAAEIKAILGSEQFTQFERYYALPAAGNYRDEATAVHSGKNILFLDPARLNEVSDQDRSFLSVCMQKIQENRSGRIRPLLDDKILTDWNALMISAYARAGGSLDNTGWLERAAGALRFIEKYLIDGDGRLLHRYRDGDAGIAGFLDDYAFLTQALLDYFENSGDPWALEWSISLAGQTKELFLSEAGDAFYFTRNDAEQLPVRKIEYHDGAIPSGNSVCAMNYQRLFHMTGSEKYLDLARALLQTQASQAVSYPSAYGQFLQALAFHEARSAEVVIAGEQETCSMLRAQLLNPFKPFKVVLSLTPGTQEALLKLAAPVRGRETRSASIYVCRDFSCQLPVFSAEEALAQL